MRFVIFALAVFGIFSCVTGRGDQSKNEESTARITGRVQIYGNEPFTFAGIVDENGTEYAVYPPSLEREISQLQGHLIEFTVIILDEPRGEGGMYLKGRTVTPLSWEIIR